MTIRHHLVVKAAEYSRARMSTTVWLWRCLHVGTSPPSLGNRNLHVTMSKARLYIGTTTTLTRYPSSYMPRQRPNTKWSYRREIYLSWTSDPPILTNMGQRIALWDDSDYASSLLLLPIYSEGYSNRKSKCIWYCFSFCLCSFCHRLRLSKNAILRG